MSAAKSVGAEFTLEQHQLSVTKTGNGTGTVSSSPAGINCGATCGGASNHNAEVTPDRLLRSKHQSRRLDRLHLRTKPDRMQSDDERGEVGDG